ncbi:sulfotransferase [Streptomyces xantholiticus]|uniref:sulfotransferase n=1 Tax=Streptomyces xantholiticus TaxID=68285 RepID=UPI0027E513E2|nr:sulfotransferase [Streptomyces xantholiticus]
MQLRVAAHAHAGDPGCATGVRGLVSRARLRRRLPVPQAGVPGSPVRPPALPLGPEVPLHLGHLDALHTVFPDATLVWCHRDPVTAWPRSAAWLSRAWPPTPTP